MDVRVSVNDSLYILKPDLLGKGEISRVFPAYRQHEAPAQPLWAIKLAKDEQHNIYLEREYETITTLRQVWQSLPAATATQPLSPPLLDVQLGTATDGRKALVMQPILRHSLLEIFEGLITPLEQEKFAIAVASQYVNLLQTLDKANISCLDRNLGDLWWLGNLESGHLVVTDWNVITKSSNLTLDLRRFGLLWFELLIGRQMPANFRPMRKDFTQIKDKVSYGLWYIIGRALGSIESQISLPELSKLLTELNAYYIHPPKKLLQLATMNLKDVRLHLNRSHADLAWIQFDIAQRLGASDAAIGLEKARQWAYDPVQQSASQIIRKLASPNFSEVKIHLQELSQKAQRPQENGDVNRLQWGYDLLNTSKDVLIKNGATIGLAQVAQEFSKVQDLLINGVLGALVEKDGPNTLKHLQQLSQLQIETLSFDDLPQLKALESEAKFWIEYQHVQGNLHLNPDMALKAVEQAKALRDLINYWPPLYEPTQKSLADLQAIIEAERRTTILSDGTYSSGDNLTHPKAAAQPITVTESRRFWLALGQDMVKNRWVESMAELLHKLELEPENEGFKIALQEIVKQLKYRHKQLTHSRCSLNTLAEQTNILEILLHLPVDLALDPATCQQMGHELTELQSLERQITQDRQELFQNLEPVLTRALAGGYELFDDPGLDVAALKTIHAAGRWEGDKFKQEIDDLEAQAQRFMSLTNLLEDRQEALKETLAFYTPLAEEPPPQETRAFYANTLRFYLSTAQTQVQHGQDVTSALNRASQLLDKAEDFLPPADYTLYKNLYEQVRELSANPIPPISENLPLPISETRLEQWFQSYQFEACHNNLSQLSDVSQKQKWLTRLNDASKIRDLLAQDIPHLDNNFFRKKQNIQLYTTALDNLAYQAKNAEPMAYALYQDKIQTLYEFLWQKLEQVDKKSAKHFEATLQITS